jgi:diguanylate cyclase (GGDEF)-like protein
VTWRDLVRTGSDAVLGLDEQLRCRFVSDALCRLFGRSAEQLLGESVDRWVPEADGASLLERLGRLSDQPLSFGVELACARAAVRARAVVRRGPGDLPYVLTFLHHEQLGAAAQALGRKVELEQLVERVQHRFLHARPHEIGDVIQWCLAEVGEHLGADRSYVLSFDHDRRCETMIHEWTAPGIAPELGTYEQVSWDLAPAATQRNNAQWASAVPDVSKLGDEWAVDRAFFEQSGLKSILELPLVIDGESVGSVGFDWLTHLAQWTEDDLTLLNMLASSLAQLQGRELVEHELAHRATHDDLTGLLNRAGLLLELERVLAVAPIGAGHGVAVVMMDIDRFKVVNDSLGSAVGDELLRAVGDRLGAIVRPHDVIARLGGDEFAVVLLDGPDGPGADAVCERVRAAMSEPFRFAGRSHMLTVSCGIAVAPAPGVAPEELLRRAGAAMFRAKEEGRARQATFDDQLEVELAQRLQMDQRLRAAMERGEFEVHFQPEHDLVTGTIVGAEALLRWRADGRLQPAADFIDVVEQTGLIVDVGRWVLEASCEQAVEWLRVMPMERFVVRVNLSARQLDRPDLIEEVRHALERSGLAPERLCLEITETALMRNPEVASVTLARLDALGVELAIDDFGTGYSSLAYLKRFPVDVLKIDRAFVTGLPADAEDTAIVRSVIALATALGMSVTAEGIEAVEQADALTALGCHRVQGYLFSRPMPAAEVTELLRRQDRSGVAGAPPPALLAQRSV